MTAIRDLAWPIFRPSTELLSLAEARARRVVDRQVVKNFIMRFFPMSAFFVGFYLKSRKSVIGKFGRFFFACR